MRKVEIVIKSQGITLVELLVALALSAILMAAVAQVAVIINQNDRTQQALSSMQEAGRFAINYLVQDIRAAGYMGCSSNLRGVSISSTLAIVPASFQPQAGIQGWDARDDSSTAYLSSALMDVSGTGGSHWSTSAGNSLEAIKVVKGSDIIKVWGVKESGTGDASAGQVLGVTALPATNTVITISSMTVESGDILIVNDCESSDLIQVCGSTKGKKSRLSLSAPSPYCPLGNIADIHFEVKMENKPSVMKLSSSLFYISKRGGINTSPPALFRRTLDSNGLSSSAQELVEGIENMQILYGENSDGDSQNVADYFVPADQIKNWQKVVSVRITLLISSVLDNLVPVAQTYSYNGITYNDGVNSSRQPLVTDRKLRRVFTTTISLRNRVLSK